MNRIFRVSLIFSIVFLAAVSEAQTPYNWNTNAHLDFDDSTQFQFFLADTAFEDNIWQIGNPQKTFIDSSFSAPYCLITDTADTYPIGNLSSAQMKLQLTEGYVHVYFTHKFESDSLLDGGCIELSIDDSTWHGFYDSAYWSSVNLEFWGGLDFYDVTDTVETLGQPGASGHSGDWIHSNLRVFYQNVQPFPEYLGLRFLFASDSIETQKDGWAIDNFHFEFGHIGIDEIDEQLGVVYPNPTSGFIRFRNASIVESFKLYDAHGRLIKELDVHAGTINVSDFPTGIYLARWVEKGTPKYSRIVIQ